MLVFGYQHHWPELRGIIWPAKTANKPFCGPASPLTIKTTPAELEGPQGRPDARIRALYDHG